MAASEKVELRKGLKDVYFDRTTASLIVSKPGKLLYRGYNIHDLARYSTFEETAYLLLHGSLPTVSQLDQFDAELRNSRELPDQVMATLHIYGNAHPMDALRGGVSAMGLADPSADDMSEDAVLKKGMTATAAVATLVAAHYRIRKGHEPMSPNPDLSHAANFLYMLHGEAPDPEDARLIDKDLVLHAEHGSNASTFAARVAASTRADFYSALTTAVSVLKGSKHGGAAEGAMQMVQTVGSVENAASYVANLLATGKRVMGFGHAVYKDVDPRSVHLKADAKALGVRKGQTKWFSIIEAIAETKEMKRRARLGTNPNVDLWSGAVYSLLGIPDDLFVPLFAVGRMPGWTLHIMEQYSKKDILRPRLHYTGPIDLEYVSLEKRGQ
jgi:citrate synthase